MTLVDRVLRWGVRLLPPRHAHFGRALLAELPAVPRRERRRWLAGGVSFVLRSLLRNALYGGGIAAAVYFLVRVDFSASDVANQACLVILLFTSAVLGLARPRLAALAGCVVGSSLATAHVVYLLGRVELPYPMSPPGWVGALGLLVLVVPAIGAAFAGALVGNVLRRRRFPPTPTARG